MDRFVAGIQLQNSITERNQSTCVGYGFEFGSKCPGWQNLLS